MPGRGAENFGQGAVPRQKRPEHAQVKLEKARCLTLAEKKIKRKDLLKEPDEFLTVSTRVIRHARDNPRTYAFGAAVAVLVVLAVLARFAYQSHRDVASHEMFEKAYQAYEEIAPQESVSPEKLDKVFEQFDQVAKDYGSLPAGETALLYSGHALYKKQDYKGALERYTRMQNTNLVKGGLGPLVTYHIAMTRMALKEYDQALVLFDQLSKDNSSPYRREAYASVAKIYELMGKNKEAVQAYRQYLKMFPEAPDASFVRTRIMDLSAKG
jgi:predicted negative regulator of RcsB-dependent stress response